MGLVTFIDSSEADLWATSPIAANVSVLPPTIVQVGSTERNVRRCKRAWCKRLKPMASKQKLKIWEQMPHLFQTIRLHC